MPKLIVLTGATRGLGRALVSRFAAAGHTVLACGRHPEHIARLAEEFGEPHGFEAVDVADDGRVATWARHCLENYGPPDLLINNAALMNRPAPLWDIPAGAFDALVHANLCGMANVIRHFVPAMVERRRGIIVNFSSGWGRSTAPEVAPYCASKWAVEGLTRALAQELPAGMAAVPLNPGIIDTGMLRTCWAEAASAYPTPDEWARTAAPFLLKLGPKDNGKPLSVG
jgi:NAD(P)-dependent dehydrogenase (short-subunit alcohol dehydrogenase family)